MKTEKPIYLIPELEVVLFGEDVLTTSGVSIHDNDPDDPNSEPGSGSQVNYGDLPFNQ